ncbi:hypothetical protein K443DRAFT_5802 [Laccaria amethystina LaAM-08-1]|uniref:Uncharacterized protein n=1 Tax=Laccaria amethystina LaAM-08-1 TaxID=1095629 RepID=A0A0C9XYZ3_9AGAR|nr:hypothetical protein K443DRAFT_5802 [Laccaria amethystina LaAM-08-1]
MELFDTPEARCVVDLSNLSRYNPMCRRPDLGSVTLLPLDYAHDASPAPQIHQHSLLDPSLTQPHRPPHIDPTPPSSCSA